MDGGAYRRDRRCAHDRAHRHGARVAARPGLDGADPGVDREFGARPIEGDVLRGHGIVREPGADRRTARHQVPEPDLHRHARSEGSDRCDRGAGGLQRARDAPGGGDRARLRAADAGDLVRQVEPVPQRLRPAASLARLRGTRPPDCSSGSRGRTGHDELDISQLRLIAISVGVRSSQNRDSG